MSFKREGNDESLLKNLSQQRVRELLGSHIPEDEAKLLSNGRLTCTICIHRPIFDTINMLSSHRRGKIHLRELGKFIKCKEDAVKKALRKCPPTRDDDKILHSKNITKISVTRTGRKPILEIPKFTMSTKVSPVLSSSGGKSTSASVRSYLKNMSRKSSLQRVVEKNRENYGADLYKCNKHVQPPETIQNITTTSSLKQNTSLDIQSLDYEMKLRMTGWIKDSTGKWTKDPNVEFDSDEDDIPPPPS